MSRDSSDLMLPGIKFTLEKCRCGALAIGEFYVCNSHMSQNSKSNDVVAAYVHVNVKFFGAFVWYILSNAVVRAFVR